MKFNWDNEVGSIPNRNKENSVEAIRELRKKLSKEIKEEDLDEINNL